MRLPVPVVSVDPAGHSDHGIRPRRRQAHAGLRSRSLQWPQVLVESMLDQRHAISIARDDGPVGLPNSAGQNVNSHDLQRSCVQRRLTVASYDIPNRTSFQRGRLRGAMSVRVSD